MRHTFIPNLSPHNSPFPTPLLPPPSPFSLLAGDYSSELPPANYYERLGFASPFRKPLFIKLRDLNSGRAEMDDVSGHPLHVLLAVSVLSGIIMCKIVYEITGLISTAYFKGYSSLKKSTKIEWKNRGFSTFHAVLVAAVSFYLILLSDLFKEGTPTGSIVHRNSVLSDSLLGVSIGYFLTDLGMILWCFPALGGMEYVLHHGCSLYAITLSLITGQAQFYILMVLFSEITTPFVNLRWYLDVYGKKSSMLYFCNGVALFLGWLVARILLFIFFFAHMFLHFDQVKTIFPIGFYSVLSVPSLIAVMNVYWFWKITKGLVKTVSRKRHAQ